MHWKRHAGEGRRAQGDPGQLAIDQVHIAALLKDVAEPDAVVDRPAAFHPISRRNTHKQGQVLRPNLTNILGNLFHQANTVLKGAAIKIGRAHV